MSAEAERPVMDPVAYDRASIDTFSGSERCRARRTSTRNGTFGRCGNRAPISERALCWRHR